MADNTPMRPTRSQADQSALAQSDILEAMGALASSGVEWQVIMAGAFGAVSHLIATNAGPAEVTKIFRKWSEATSRLA